MVPETLTEILHIKTTPEADHSDINTVTKASTSRKHLGVSLARHLTTEFRLRCQRPPRGLLHDLAAGLVVPKH